MKTGNYYLFYRNFYIFKGIFYKLYKYSLIYSKLRLGFRVSCFFILRALQAAHTYHFLPPAAALFLFHFIVWSKYYKKTEKEKK